MIEKTVHTDRPAVVGETVFGEEAFGFALANSQEISEGLHRVIVQVHPEPPLVTLMKLVKGGYTVSFGVNSDRSKLVAKMFHGNDLYEMVEVPWQSIMSDNWHSVFAGFLSDLQGP